MISYLLFIAVGVVVLTWFIVGNIFSKINNAGTTIPTTHVNNRRTDSESDSEEDEGLFGKQQKSSGLFDGPRQPSNSQGSSKSSDSLSRSAKSLGVKNVRAMPDATPTKTATPIKPKMKEENNLFVSDSDDEGDLFSSKPAASGRTTNNVSNSLDEGPVLSSGGLFSSDEESPLFSGPAPTPGPKDTKEVDEHPLPQPKESGRKVPVGGVSIFGTAITSALRQHQQSSDEEPSDDDVPNTNTTKHTQPPPPKPDERVLQKPANIKMPVKGTGGLFDSDEDENLFDTLVRKPVSVTHDVNTHSSAVSSRSENIMKGEDKKSHMDNQFDFNQSGKDSISKSAAEFFSDEEDSIYNIPKTVKNKSLSEKSPKVIAEAAKPEVEAVKASRPPSLFTPPDHQIPSQPVNISDLPKSNNSLFSSPSDDDDIFSSISKPVPKASHASAFMTDPPPLPPQSSNNHTESASKELPQLGALDNADINESTKDVPQGNSKESVSSSLFSSTSDEDIFSSLTTNKDSPQISAPQANKEKNEFSKSGKESELGTKTAATLNSKNESHSEMETSGGIFHSPTDNIFKPISQTPDNESKQDEVSDQGDGACKGLSNLFPKKDTDIHSNKKDDNLFGSTDDLFGVTEKSQNTGDCSRTKEDSHGPLKSDIHHQVDLTTSSMEPGDDKNETSRLPEEDNSKTLNEITLRTSPSSSQSTLSPAVTHEPKLGATKPPVGGVALFGGKELAAQINKRKTLLEPAGEKEQKIENNIFDDVQDLVSEGESHSKTVMYDDSDDDIFGDSTGSSKKSISTSLYRQSPPLLPEEAEKIFSQKQEPERVQIPKSKHTNVDGKTKNSDDIDSDQQKPKPDKSEDENKKEIANKEIKSKRKPPIGGVSMFGSGEMRGSELFAKVLQRKSMLAPESDSSEEDTTTEPTGATKPTIPSEEKGTAPSKLVVPVSPVSPISADVRESKPGGEESSVSFNDPATHSNVLQSVNKTRVRGSIKRRPPSRAHRKSGVDTADTSDTHDSSSTIEAPSPGSTTASSLEHTHVKATDVSKTESVQVSEKVQHPSANKGQRKVPRDVEQNEVKSASANMQSITSNKGSHCTEGTSKAVSASHEKNKEVASADNKDVLNAPQSALGMSKTNSKNSSFLFGGSDSDEDLFGEVKQKPNVKNPLMSSEATGVPKIASKNSRSHSLFEDDDDDASIFSSKSQAKNVTAGVSRNVPISKQKGNLKQSSEPFEDPLLASLKK